MKTGWPPGLLQDDDRNLSRWFASRPGARYQVRKNIMEQQQPEAQQEPVAWQWLDTGTFRKSLPASAEPGAWRPLYTTAPAEQRQWVELDGFDIEQILTTQPNGEHMNLHWFYNAARAIEAKLKEKNA